MPKKCKDLFELSMKGKADIRGAVDEETGKITEWTEEERKFLFDKNGDPIVRTYANFKVGLKVPGKLRPKRISGGILLVDTPYEMRWL